MRLALVLGFVAAVGCAPARPKLVGRTSLIMALAGVATIITAAAISGRSKYADELMVGGSAISAAGIVLYAAHEMSGTETVYVQESTERKHARWARILTDHAAGAARSGNCAPVRKFEPRVRVYDANYHDFVFMRDPEILRCLSPSSEPSESSDPIQVEPSEP